MKSDRTMASKILMFVTVCLAVFLPIISADAAVIVDAINGSSEPETTPIGLQYGFDHIGWYYTPVTGYELTRLETKFDTPFTYSGNGLVGVTIYSERPSQGGLALASGTISPVYTSAGLSAEWSGTNFSPLLLTGGTRYFIGFSDLLSEGVNITSWRSVGGVPTIDGDTDLGANFRGADYSQVFTDSFVTGGNGSQPAPNSPILRFNGNVSAVPEPSAFCICVVASCSLVFRRRNKD